MWSTELSKAPISPLKAHAGCQRCTTVRVRCSLGPPTPRGSTPGNVSNLQRYRVSAVATQLTPSIREPDMVFKLSDLPRNDLNYDVGTYVEDRPDPTPEVEASQGDRNDEIEGSRQYLSLRSSSSLGASTSAPVTVRSTKRPRPAYRRRRNPTPSRAEAQYPQQQPQQQPQHHQTRRNQTSFSQKPPAPMGVETELQADAAYLADLRASLTASRRSRPTRGEIRDAVSLFLQGIKNTPVLTSRQEQRLGLIMLRGRTVRKTAADMARASGARPTLEDIAAASGLSSGTAAARAILLADDARALMAEFNLRLVFNMARRAHHINQASIELSDLVSEGTQGMYKAIDRWDPSRKLRFSTYGHWWIRQSISRFISRHIRDVRLPVHVHDLGVKIHRIAGEIEDDPEQSTLDSHKLVADALGLSVERVVAIARHTRIPKTPLDTSASDNSLRTPKDISQNGFALDAWGNDDTDDPAPNPVLEAEREEHLRAITTVLLCSLPVRERNILQLRYGINPMSSVDTGEDSDDNEEWEQRTSSNGIFGSKGSDDGRDGVTAASEREVSPSALRSVGSTYKLSKERIRQLEAEALRRLRSSWRLRLVQLLQSGQPLTQETMQALFEARSAQDGSSALRVLSSVGVTDDVVYLRGMSGGEQRIG